MAHSERMRASLEEAEVAVRRVGRTIGDQMPKGWGFVLVMASHGEDGFATYLSNMEREGTVKLLREMADKVDRGTEQV